MPPKPPLPVPDKLESLLRRHAKELQALIDDGRRLHREITEHLDKLKHAGDPPPPYKPRRQR